MKVKVPVEVAAAARAIARETFRDACRANGKPFDAIMAIRSVEASWTMFINHAVEALKAAYATLPEPAIEQIEGEPSAPHAGPLS